MIPKLLPVIWGEQNMIEIKNLTAGYGAVTVLRDISMEIKTGECVGIIGPNGAGKSTLLRAISCLTDVGKGEIIFDGKAIHTMKPWNIAKVGIAHVPEGRQLFGTLTVEENLVIALDTVRYPANERKERFEFIWNLFPVLIEKWNMKAGSLSGGQQQMVAVARGLVVKPKVLLLDEPSLGLAPIVTQEIQAAVEKLKGGSMCIIVADQNANMVLSMTEHVYGIAEGQVSLEGVSSELEKDDAVWKSYMNN